MKKLSLLATSVLLTLPMGVGALKINPPCMSGGCLTDPGKILNAIIGWILGFAALIAVLFLIFGGILYIASAGNKERAEQAKKTIMTAVIGLVVIVLSYFIVQLVLSFAPALTK